MFTFDFETQAIQPRPDYPPQPVGLATTRSYMGWGHPTGNNCGGPVEPTMLLGQHWHEPLLCHNAAFDLAVAHERFGLPLPEGSQVNDTMFLAFLLDPYGDLGLKPLAERYLGIPPTERDAVRDWLYANKVVRKNVKKWGAHIAQAPGELVGPYAIGDCTRTLELFKHLYPKVVDAGMLAAYKRECAIVPMLLDNSAQGIPLDHKRLKVDTAAYEAVLRTVDSRLHRLLGKINLDSGEELGAALRVKFGAVLPLTPTGKISTAKETLLSCLPDMPVKGLLVYRSAIEKCLSTYMRPWVEQGRALHANWNQVRDYSDNGACTGRLSSSPNLQNMTNPEKYDEVYSLLERCGVTGITALPNLRSYLVAPKGMVLFSRDYSQQEFRMLAHYEDGVIAQAYRDNPDADMHVIAMTIINDVTNVGIERKPTKTINFGKVYGMGVPKLAASLRISVDDAYTLMNAYDKALPSVKALMKEVGSVGKRGECITTIGGRRYYSPPAEYVGEGWKDMLADLGLEDRVWREKYDKPPPPKTRNPKALTREQRLSHYKFMGAQIRTYEYKLLNYLMQGGSADQTKEAMRLWWEMRLQRSTNGTRFLMTIHDQLVGCCPKKDAKKESAALDEYMVNAFTLDVPTKTDPTYGTNFGEMKK